MDQTFSMQRHEIVDADTPVKALMERWPALFMERQDRAVDRYTPRFVTIFKSKKGSIGEKLDELMQQINTGACEVEAWAQVSVGVLTVIDEHKFLSK
ncbi:hypothetical protein QQF64_012981 [Cirrhinus molitorella]|uniref:Uncharacterized protein n=1 Tax=Cirrhinus molitorella TaxID=172907 RepID=A0ABR3LRH3_9TELE